MILDNSLIFSTDQAITTTAASETVIDLTQAGAGNAFLNRFGTAAVFGEDIGIGDGASPPQLAVIVGDTFASNNPSDNLFVQLQEAPDNGSGSPGSYVTTVQTGALVLAQLLAGTKIAEFTVPPRAPGAAFPRFLRLNYLVGDGSGGAGTMTAGTIAWAGVVTGRDDAPMYPAAY